MDENETKENIPANDKIIIQQNGIDKTFLENTCLVNKKCDDLTVVESSFVLENLVDQIKENINVNSNEEVKSLLLESINEQICEENGDKSMEVDEESSVLPVETNGNDQNINHIDTDIQKNITNDVLQDKLDENFQIQEYHKLVYDWTCPKFLYSSLKEFKPTEKCENFTKGCHWSPDGTCILVPSEDFRIRLFDLPKDLYTSVLPKNFSISSYESSVRIKEGGLIYDSCWFPYMNSWDPSTCCFLSTSQGSPVHLWDAFTGELRATYRAYNLVDEVEAAMSVQFTDCGGKVWSGFKNFLRIFDTNRPGRQIYNISFKNDFPNVSGLVSCIRENPTMSGLIAFGTYSKSIGLYKDGPLCSFKTGSGVTQIEFSPCGTKLYSAIRKGSEFLCWDLRNPGLILYSLQNRQSDTNQRIYFDISYNGEEIVSGGTDGSVRVWRIPSDLQVDEDLDPNYKIKISKDCINGVSLHKNLPILAVSTGRRICSEEENIHRDNSLRFYWLGNIE